MANLLERYEDNVPGKWYVDKECIYCCLCSQLAPNNFKTGNDDNHDIVYKQPETPEELEACMKSMDQCPVEAIGNNGE